MPTLRLSSSVGAVERVWKVNIACFAGKQRVTAGLPLASRVAEMIAERGPALSAGGLAASMPEAFERCSADPAKPWNAQVAVAVEMCLRFADIAFEMRFVASAGRCFRLFGCLDRHSLHVVEQLRTPGSEGDSSSY